MKSLSHEQASKLLHNKFVVVLGDSIQRAVYKDLVLLLQTDRYLSQSQLKTKGELIFEQDCLVEGGCSSIMTNGTEYREVRQYRSDHHLVRFYFLTRIFSRYMEGVLEDFRCGLTPDVVVVNSCVWDVSRYSSTWVKDYRENLERFFEELRNVLPQESLVVWNLTMPLGKNISGGFLVPEVAHMGPTLRYDIVEANFYAGKLADAYGLDVLDLHFLFRFSLQHRMRDGVHWNALAHRRITSLLLRHAAQAWGVELPGRPPSLPELQYQGTGKQFYTDSLPSCPTSGSGYFNFKEDRPAPRPPAPRPPALLPTPRPPPPVSAPRPSPPPRRRTHPARPGGGSRGHAPHLAYRTVHHHPMAPPQYWPGNQYVMRNCHTRHYYAPYHAPYHIPYHAPYHALYAYQRQHHYPYPPY